MAKFYAFPSHSMQEHVDEQLNKVNDTEHLLTQGWTQAFADVASILEGKWLKNSPTTDASSTCNWTPWGANIFIDFEEAKEYTITMPIIYKGVLQILTSSLLHKEYILVDGSSFNYTANVGDIMQGALSSKK